MMVKIVTKSPPPKIAEIGQNSTIIFNKGYPAPPGRVKRFTGHPGKPDLETRDIKGFQKMAFLTRKRGFKGVLRGCKGVFKKISKFCQFNSFSQTPFFRLEVIE